MKIKIIVLVTLWIITNHCSMALTTWRTVAPGIQYTELHPLQLNPLAKIHAFKVDLLHYRLVSTFARELQQPIATVRVFAQHQPSLINVNGGFFTPLLQPLGLRINNKEVKSPLKTISWWGVFYTVGEHAYVVSSRNYKPNSQIDFAIQGGPRLIVNGRIPRLKVGEDQRTALGIDRSGDVVILVTDNLALTTTELARIMRRSESRNGLDCLQALNLDGGGSTQMYAHFEQLTVNILGLTGVTDALQVRRR